MVRPRTVSLITLFYALGALLINIFVTVFPHWVILDQVSLDSLRIILTRYGHNHYPIHIQPNYAGSNDIEMFAREVSMIDHKSLMYVGLFQYCADFAAYGPPKLNCRNLNLTADHLILTHIFILLASVSLLASAFVAAFALRDVYEDGTEAYLLYGQSALLFAIAIFLSCSVISYGTTVREPFGDLSYLFVASVDLGACFVISIILAFIAWAMAIFNVVFNKCKRRSSTKQTNRNRSTTAANQEKHPRRRRQEKEDEIAEIEENDREKQKYYVADENAHD